MISGFTQVQKKTFILFIIYLFYFTLFIISHSNMLKHQFDLSSINFRCIKLIYFNSQIFQALMQTVISKLLISGFKDVSKCLLDAFYYQFFE